VDALAELLRIPNVNTATKIAARGLIGRIIFLLLRDWV
jgi:hypothetical protein